MHFLDMQRLYVFWTAGLTTGLMIDIVRRCKPRLKELSAWKRTHKNYTGWLLLRIKFRTWVSRSVITSYLGCLKQPSLSVCFIAQAYEHKLTDYTRNVDDITRTTKLIYVKIVYLLLVFVQRPRTVVIAMDALLTRRSHSLYNLRSYLRQLRMYIQYAISEHKSLKAYLPPNRHRLKSICRQQNSSYYFVYTTVRLTDLV